MTPSDIDGALNQAIVDVLTDKRPLTLRERLCVLARKADEIALVPIEFPKDLAPEFEDFRGKVTQVPGRKDEHRLRDSYGSDVGRQHRRVSA